MLACGRPRLAVGVDGGLPRCFCSQHGIKTFIVLYGVICSEMSTAMWCVREARKECC